MSFFPKYYLFQKPKKLFGSPRRKYKGKIKKAGLGFFA